jgi:hypothetical protein
MPQSLLEAVKSREPQSSFGYGITTADKYVSTLQQCVGSDLCYRYGSTKSTSFNDALQKAAKTLVYSNPEMEIRNVAEDVYTKKAQIQQALPGLDLPKNTLMVFKHVLTTPHQDRDGDILRTKGAKPDPKMLLLWQHVHTLPIGKALGVAKHTETELQMYTAIVDLNELAHDAAVMVDNGMGRFSHGFKALKFEKMKDAKVAPGKPTGGGFDVKEFEIMEESLVSVPANVQAETLEVMLELIESDKLTSSMMKSYGKELRARRPKLYAFTEQEEETDVDETNEKGAGGGCGCGCNGAPGGCGKGKPKKKPAPKETDASSDKEPTDGDGGAEDDEVKDGMCPKCKTKLKSGVCPDCGYGKTEDDADTEKAHDFVFNVEALQVFTKAIKSQTGHAAPDEDLQLLGMSDSLALVADESGILYELTWEQKAEGPVVTEIKVNDEIDFDDEQPADTKAGKVLSKSNLDTLKEVYEDVKELQGHCSTRSGKALCSKCSMGLKSVIDLATKEESNKPKDFNPATWLIESTPGQRAKMHAALTALVAVDQQADRTAQFQKTIGNITEK